MNKLKIPAQLRLIADYKGDPVELEDAAWAVQQAERFVQTMKLSYQKNE